MIPKIVHYCWFGGKSLPELAQKCIASWRKYLPDYEIKEWNEENFDINSNVYVAEAYHSRKFAFVADYARLYALYHEGGIYMDTDVEVVRCLDRFLCHPAFSGFENDTMVSTGIMGSDKGGKWVKENLEYYRNKHFLKEDGSFDLTTNVETITAYMLPHGLSQNNTYQDFPGLFTLYPKDYFCPKDHGTGQIFCTENTHCIHHFAMSWISPKETRLSRIKRRLMKIFGVNTINGVIRIFHLKSIKKRLFH